MKLTKIVLIVAAASCGAGSALAQESIGEPSYLGMKRGRYVPAPAPVPETFNWYLRADIGVGFTDGGATDKGTFGNGGGGVLDNDFWAATPERINWFDAKADPFFQGGIGFGKYISPRFRMDVTIDAKTADKYGGSGTFTYNQVSPPPGLAPTGDTVTVTGVDRVDVIDGVGLINAYLDLVPRGRFTPYIGLGAGFAVRYVDRTHDSLEEETGGGGSSRVWSGTNKDTKFAPAVSAPAGIAWALAPGTIFDVNYRYTYIGSVDTSMAIAATDGSTVRSKITIDESHQHVIRAGLRWNIW
jgi:opacity protein-like surface antigen